MSRLGRAMCDPMRASVLAALAAGPCYPALLADQLGTSRANLSNHLACLRGCGLVVATGEGRRVRYEIADPHLTSALTALLDVVLAVDDGLECSDSGCDCCMQPSAEARGRGDDQSSDGRVNGTVAGILGAAGPGTR